MSTRRGDYSKNTNKTKKKAEPKDPPVDDVKKPSSAYDRITEMKEMFKLFDLDGDGFITREELGKLMFSLGRVSTQEETQKALEEIDQNGNDKIEMDEFTTWMEKNYTLSPNKVEDIVQAFKIFDLDGNGWISCEEFKHILMKFGGEFTEDEVEHIFRESDLNNDGKLAYAEFVDLWKFQ